MATQVEHEDGRSNAHTLEVCNLDIEKREAHLHSTYQSGGISY